MEIITILASNISLFLYKNNIVDRHDLEIYQYGDDYFYNIGIHNNADYRHNSEYVIAVYSILYHICIFETTYWRLSCEYIFEM